MIADTIGTIVLAIEAVVLAVLFRLPSSGALLLFILLVSCGVYFWHSERALKSSTEWMWLTFGSLVLGAIWFACDAVIGRMNNPGLTIVDAATRAGGPFGIFATAIVCPGLTAVALAGLVRAAYIEGYQSRKEREGDEAQR